MPFYCRTILVKKSINRQLWAYFSGISKVTIGSYFVPHARESPLVSALQPILGRKHGTTCSFVQFLQADIRVSLSGPRHVERLAKGREEIQEMGHLSDSVEETGSIHISWTGPHQLSGSPGLTVIQNRL